jgi:predicted transcriptional regulator
MHERGRAALGVAKGTAKLTDSMVLEIRERRSNGARQKDLADQYGVSASNISEIVNGLVWQHVGGPIGGRSKRTARSPRSRNYNKEAA